MAAAKDDLEAVRSLVETLQPFKLEERERILRWTREKLKMSPATSDTLAHDATAPTPASSQRHAAPPILPPVAAAANPAPATNIKAFVNEKGPKSDVHFAVTVAYFYQFIAPLSERKDSITKQDIVNACRMVPRKQPKRVDQLLVNTYHGGFFDRGETGHYKLNAVGENLVAMTLPGDGTGVARRRVSSDRIF